MILNYLKPAPYLSAKEEKEIIIQCQQNNNSAKEQLVRSNIKYIYSEAKKLSNKHCSTDDLVMLGIYGLLCATTKFDISKSNRFITFAIFWIRKEMLNYIYAQSTLLKISSQKLRLAAQIRKKYTDFSYLNNNSLILEKTANYCNCKTKEAEELLILTTHNTNINANNEEYSILDFLESETLTPEENFIEKNIKNQLIESIKRLKPIEQDVIIRHYGLFNNPTQTLEEIAKIKNKTKSRIHQIEKEAKEKLFKALSA